MNKNTKKLTFTALGIALYVLLSMTMKIPLIGHIGLDLGYIVFAVYCYHFGILPGVMVGGIGCILVSLLTSGWFPPGWLLGNILIGIFCGWLYKHENTNYAIISNIVVTIAAVALGILGVKTIVECSLYSIPLAVKVPKSIVAFVTDAIVMCAGTLLARNKTITHYLEDFT